MRRIRTTKQKNRSHIPFRLNIVFFVTFLAFIALFARLAHLQLYQGQYFKSLVEETVSTRSTGAVPRGMMYDSKGRVLVGNHPELAILYTRDGDSRVAPDDIAHLARELASLIDIPIEDLTTRDLKEYFVVLNTNEINQRLTKEQRQLPGSELYQYQLDAVTDEDIQYSDAEKKIIALFQRMNSAFALSTVTVKNKNVTPEEIARVSEHLGELPGISVGTDWQRIYPKKEMLRSILGQVSTEKRGLPKENMNKLLAQGYARNDRVGISYLEKQYENSLRGSKSIYNVITNSDDDIIENQMIYEGRKGDNLVLTIDSEFQEKIEEIAERSLVQMNNKGLNDRIYIVAMNPQTGDILGIAGKRYEYNEDTDSYNTDKIIDDALGAINTSYGMGSSVKPAMVAMGYLENIITPTNNVIVDEPMKFQASAEKSSVFNRTGKVSIDDIEALEKSSNIYMIKLAMAIGGQTTYEQEGKLSINEDTIQILRQHFAQFGLGTQTGIDIPNETSGFSPESDQLVNALDLSYGQFDLYTPLQLAQFVSTIASDGVRYSPRLVKEIRGTDVNGQLGGVKASLHPHIMNVIGLEPEAMERIQEGMRQVARSNDGTARYYFQNYPIELGAKTGTAEAFYAGPIRYAANQPVTNATFVGYAPFDNPEIAISVVVPYLDESAWGRESTIVAHEVMNAYFEMKADTKASIEEYMKTFVAPS